MKKGKVTKLSASAARRNLYTGAAPKLPKNLPAWLSKAIQETQS